MDHNYYHILQEQALDEPDSDIEHLENNTTTTVTSNKRTRSRSTSKSSTVKSVSSTSTSAKQQLKKLKQVTLDVLRPCVGLKKSGSNEIDEAEHGHTDASDDENDTLVNSSEKTAQSNLISNSIDLNEPLSDVNVTKSIQNDSRNFDCSNATNDGIAILDGTFFKIVSSERKNNNIHVTAQCQKCLPVTTKISGLINSSTNFKRHLNAKHPATVKKYEEYIKNRKKKNSENEKDLSSSGPTKDLDDFMIKVDGTEIQMPRIKTQKEFENRIVDFFIDSLAPPSFVEKASFRNTYNFKLFSRRKLMRLIDNRASALKEKIIRELKNAKYVAVASDVWKNSQRCFIGVTATIIDKSYQRHNYVLCCRRICGTIDYDNIASFLTNLFDEFQINTKVVACVTDNGSNYVKAFRVFGLTNTSFKIDIHKVEMEECLESLCLEEEIEFIEYPRLNPDASDIIKYSLPAHIRCGSHTLSLVATTDFNKILKENQNITRVHQEAIEKCEILWRAVHNPKSYEVVEKTIGGTLTYPTAVRWNSLFDSINHILRYEKEDNKLSMLYRQLGKENERLLPSDLQYLHLYETVMEPIALGIDYLQGDKYLLFGTYIVTIHTIYNKYREMITSDNGPLTTIKKKLAEELVNKISLRFKDELELDLTKEHIRIAVLAATCHPMLKLSWFRNDWNEEEVFQKETEIKEIMIHEIMNLRIHDQNTPKSAPEGTSLNTVSQNQDQEPGKRVFFHPKKKDDSSQLRNKAQAEVILYFQNSADLNDLKTFINIEQMFLKYNTPLPSSASVERCFNYATIINKSRRHLSDKNFENAIFLKCNKL